MNLAAISISVAIGALALVVRWRARAWSNPAVIFAAFWCLMTLVPLLGAASVPAPPAGLAYLLAAAVAFSLPSLVMNWGPAIEIAERRRYEPWAPPQGLLLAFIAAQAVSIVCVAINIKLQGLSLAELFTHPIQFACEYLNARYGGHIHANAVFEAGTVLNYVGAPLGGFVLATRKGLAAKFGVIILSLLPSILDILVYADKGTLPLTLAYLFGGVIAGRLAIGNTALFTRQTALACIAIFVVLVPVMLVGLINRGGDCADQTRGAKIFGAVTSVIGARAAPDKAPTLAPALNHNLKSYAFGHVFAFSDWFDNYLTGGGTQHYVNPPNLTLGFWTFMAVGKLIDRHYQVPDGYYAEYFEAPDKSLGTNIYTMYRGLIYDFGLAGSLVSMALIGWGAALAYRSILERGRAPLGQSVMIALAGFIYSSFALSVGTWLSVYAAGVLVFAILWLCQRNSAQLLVEPEPDSR